MASIPLETYQTAMGEMLKGVARGQQEGQDQAKQNQLDQQRQVLQAYQIRQDAQRQAAAPYEALAPHLSMLSPGSQLDVLQGLSGGGKTPDLSGVAGAFPAGSPARNVLMPPAAPAPSAHPYGLPFPTAPAGPFVPPTEMPPPVAPGAPTPAPPPGATPSPFGGPSGLPGGPPTLGAAGPAPPAAPPSAPAAPPAAPRTFTGPGGQQLSLAGVSEAERAKALRRVDQATGKFADRDLPDEFRGETVSLIAQAQRALRDAKSPEEFRAAQDLVDQIEGRVAEIPGQKKAGVTGSLNGLLASYNRTREDLQKHVLPANAAFATIRALRQMETRIGDIQAKNPDLIVPGAANYLQDYAPQIEEMEAARAQADALRAKPDRTAAETADLKAADQHWRGLATDIYNGLHYGQDPEKQARTVNTAMNTLRGWIGMLSPEQRTPEVVAGWLRRQGLESEATYVEEHGLNFGGAQAEENTIKLLGRMGEVMRPGTPPQAQAAYAAELADQSSLTGHPIRLDPAQLTRVDPKDRPGTPEFEQAKLTREHMALEIDKLRRDGKAEMPGGTKWEMQNVDLLTKQARLRQLTGKDADPAVQRTVAAHRMSAAQHAVDDAYRLYARFLTDNPDIDKTAYDPAAWKGDVSGIRDPVQRQGTQLFQNWQRALAGQQNLFNTLSRAQPKTPTTPASGRSGARPSVSGSERPTPGGRTPPPADRDKPRSVTINGRAVTTTPAQAYETLQRSVRAGRMTPAQANATMTSLFGAR